MIITHLPHRDTARPKSSQLPWKQQLLRILCRKNSASLWARVRGRARVHASVCVCVLACACERMFVCACVCVCVWMHVCASSICVCTSVGKRVCVSTCVCSIRDLNGEANPRAEPVSPNGARAPQAEPVLPDGARGPPPPAQTLCDV